MISSTRPEFIEGQAERALRSRRQHPDFLIPKSPFYDIEVLGTEPDGVVLSIPIPNDSLPPRRSGFIPDRRRVDPSAQPCPHRIKILLRRTCPLCRIRLWSCKPRLLCRPSR